MDDLDKKMQEDLRELSFSREDRSLAMTTLEYMSLKLNQGFEHNQAIHYLRGLYEERRKSYGRQ